MKKAARAELAIPEREGSPINIDKAFLELSGGAFAAWVRLCSIETYTLRCGGRAIARQVGVPARSMHYWLVELAKAGYVTREVADRGRCSSITLRKRPMITRLPSTFVIV